MATSKRAANNVKTHRNEEEHWKDKFDEIFQSLKHNWSFSSENPNSLPRIENDRSKGWKRFQDKGKAHFECLPCNNRWSSIKGAVIFHYRLNRGGQIGEVKMWLLRQKCRKRKCNEGWQEGSWSHYEIERVLENLLRKVKEKFYEEGKENVNTKQQQGHMSSGHEREYCEACQNGVCGQRKDDDEVLNAVNNG